jgi:hypothetical protein
MNKDNTTSNLINFTDTFELLKNYLSKVLKNLLSLEKI